MADSSERGSTYGSMGSISDETPGRTPREGGEEPAKRKLSPLDITLHELLGKGSYGMVYRATAAGELNRTVAVKILPWGPEEVSGELRRELKMLQRCHSSAIVRAFGAFAKPRELWLVMEYCDLGSLLDVMRAARAPLSEGAVAIACRDALHGLLHLHSMRKGIIHRDVKCANLLLSSEGEGKVKLADFGVAAQLNSTASKRNSVTGTPHWMAPEVVQNGTYDMRADVWSLGITAIEMAQMAPPLHDMRPVLKVMFHIASKPAPFFNEPEKYSEEFREFVTAALEKDPLLRPDSTEMYARPFVANAKREDLKELIKSALWFKSNPRPPSPANSLDDSTLGGSLTMHTAQGHTLGASPAAGGTFCEHESGDGTFVMHGTGGGGTFVHHDGTLPAKPADGQTLRSADLPLASAERDLAECVQRRQLVSVHTPRSGSSAVVPGMEAQDDTALMGLQRSESKETPRGLPRATSDDALFERAASRFVQPSTGSSAELHILQRSRRSATDGVLLQRSDDIHASRRGEFCALS